ncbi:MAG: ribonuclease HII [Caldilineales bacterium]|nr:ribonuclease HII [Caldilineales bacterium]MDW8317452.1 ribonuclease HII [Anaerolineae bacterium]
MQRPTVDEESRLWAAGYRAVAGVDEAGRGAWAGPVVAAAVILPPDLAALCSQSPWTAVADSKLLSPAQREALYPAILAAARSVGVGMASARRIDAVGILQATREAMLAALSALDSPPDFVLVDHVALSDAPAPHRALVKGDRRVLSIAAASVVAKVVRDRWMAQLDPRFPAYGFGRHKGYGTPGHRDALMRLGPCPEHRRSFAPVQSAVAAPDAARP